MLYIGQNAHSLLNYLVPTHRLSCLHKYEQETGISLGATDQLLYFRSLFIDTVFVVPVDHQVPHPEQYIYTSNSVELNFHSAKCFSFVGHLCNRRSFRLDNKVVNIDRLHCN